MSSKKLVAFTFTSFLAIAVGITACKKNNDTPANNDPQENKEYAFNNALLEQQFDELQSFADQAQAGGSFEFGGSCTSMVRDTANKTIMIDFGKNDCLCKDGRRRRGIVTIVYKGSYKDSGSMRTITFKDYHVDDNMVFGTKTIMHIGWTAGQTTYKSVVNGGMVLAKTKDTISADVIRTRIQVGGQSTSVFTDDVYQITGSGTFMNMDKKTYVLSIKAPLVVALNCNWIKQGVIEFNGFDNNTRIIDFGDFGCEHWATLKINGVAQQIMLQ